MEYFYLCLLVQQWVVVPLSNTPPLDTVNLTRFVCIAGYLGLAALTTVEIMFTANISYARCLKVVWLEPGMLMAMILAAEVLLIMRVWALWDRAIWVPCLFVVMLSAEIGVSIWSLSMSCSLQCVRLIEILLIDPFPPQSAVNLCRFHHNSIFTLVFLTRV